MKTQNCGAGAAVHAEASVRMDLTLGVRKLFGILPKQSALRAPLSRVLFDHMSLSDIEELNLPLNIQTIKRYRAEEMSMGSLKEGKFKETALRNSFQKSVWHQTGLWMSVALLSLGEKEGSLRPLCALRHCSVGTNHSC